MGQFRYDEWWEKNKAAVNKKRRERWKSDPEYRAKAKEWGRTARKKEVKERRNAVAIRRSGVREPEEVEWGGKAVLAYGTDVLARYIGRSKTTVYAWEQREWLPRTPLLSSRGEKLFTPGMMRVVKSVVKRFESKGLQRGRGKVDGEAMHDAIWSGWMKLKEDGEEPVRLNFKKMIAVPKVEVRTVEVGGRKMEAFTTDTLARAVGRSRYQMAVWEERGFLPKTPFKSHRDWRLYTKRMIRVVKAAMRKREFPDKEMFMEIVSGWREAGIEPCK